MIQIPGTGNIKKMPGERKRAIEISCSVAITAELNSGGK
jgi:hypothetical protein